jgi:hypothetical protein
VPTFPKVKDGDAITPLHFNLIYRELERLRKLTAAAPLSLDNIDSDNVPSLAWLGADELVPVQLTSALAAGSIGTPGSATCNVLLDQSTGPGFTSTGAATETIYNCYATAIASGKYGWGKYRGGTLYAVVFDC